MKNQVLFSSKDKNKKLKCRLLQFWFGALSVYKKIRTRELGVLVHVRLQVFSSFSQKRVPGQRCPFHNSICEDLAETDMKVIQTTRRIIPSFD